MTLIRFRSGAIVSSRFGISPLAETLSAVTVRRLRQATGGPSRLPTYVPSGLRSDKFAEGLLSLITQTKYLPSFVSLPPQSGVDTTIEQELLIMASVSDEVALQEVLESTRWSTRPHPDLSWTHTRALAARSAVVLRGCWAEFVAPDWKRRRAILERDIQHRAGLLALHGWRHVMEGINAPISWEGPDALRFSGQTFADREVHDDGLILVPHTGQNAQWTCEADSRIALVYPAWGVQMEFRESPSRLGALIGEQKYYLLASLVVPATPTQLALGSGQSLGTISHHIRDLRESGAGIGQREGRSVYYRLTDAGRDLLDVLSSWSSIGVEGCV